MSKKEVKKAKSDDQLVQVKVAGAIPFETNSEFLMGITGNWEILAAAMDSAQKLIKDDPTRAFDGYVMFDAAHGALIKDMELIELFYSSMHETTAEEIESDTVTQYNFVPL
jgi:hypothetical protein